MGITLLWWWAYGRGWFWVLGPHLKLAIKIVLVTLFVIYWVSMTALILVLEWLYGPR